MRSRLRRDGAGLLACPDEGRGLDEVTLSRLNAQILERYTGAKRGPSDGRMDTGGREYAKNPVTILGDACIAWWDTSTIVLGAGTGGTSSGWRTKVDDHYVRAAETDEEANVEHVRHGWVGLRNRQFDFRSTSGAPTLDGGRLVFEGLRTITAAGPQLFPADVTDPDGTRVGNNLCVWYVCKPSDTFPLIHFQDASNNKLLSLTTDATNGFKGQLNVASAGDSVQTGVAPDGSRRLWSFRREADKIVAKMSDAEAETETTEAISAVTVKLLIVSAAGAGDSFELDEMVLSLATPTSDQIDDMESYFADRYSDLVTTT